MRIIFLFLFLIGCAKGNFNNPNVINYFSYEKYDFMTDQFIPGNDIILSDMGDYFSISKNECENKSFRVISKVVDIDNIHYKLGPIDEQVSFHPCFSDYIDLDLIYKGMDTEKTYYETTLSGDLYKVFKDN